jgi:hypothetical protein
VSPARVSSDGGAAGEKRFFSGGSLVGRQPRILEREGTDRRNILQPVNRIHAQPHCTAVLAIRRNLCELMAKDFKRERFEPGSIGSANEGENVIVYRHPRGTILKPIWSEIRMGNDGIGLRADSIIEFSNVQARQDKTK